MLTLKILVTGGAGFIGSNIVDGLIKKDYEVAIVDNLSTGNEENVNAKADFYKLDIIDPRLSEVFERFNPDVVIHHAAQIDVQKSIKEPIRDAQTNILGTISILDCCKKFKVSKVIYASSAAVYGNPEYLGVDEKHIINPISNYGISKYVPEQYIRLYASLFDIDYTIFRYSNVYGIRQDPKGEGGVISIFVDRILNNINPIIFGDGEQSRDFIYVKDIVAANIAALEKGSKTTINISTNTQISINKLVETLGIVSSKEIHPKYANPRTGDITHSYLINKLAKKELNWEPTYDLIQGLKETWEYYYNKRIKSR